ncbi:hypothetical protein N7537_008944 [Penicillium hordei]|uniref:Uncharacterized protein n=1 Tax=Penicillium hordei TaxID=40994 RepID=A0AAD6E1D9_9EURO|nr:uncharacterized protein N7537_008944 [Penicillium hordei]KAJ5598860.1 hypothetical protein N7537_008944 [Penicillium hordei]
MRRAFGSTYPGHDANGVTGFQDQIPGALEWQQMANGALFSLAYATNEIPVQLSNDKDLGIYKSNLEDPPGITIPGGTVLRMVDMKPGSISPMHRTISLDYGVFLKGEVELILDSGETRLLKRGDIAKAKPLEINGNALEEDYGGGIDDVKPSK